ncbi:MAG: hypothetical protein JKY11_07495 [Alphaproteobacteria bacterium]|nr:hypothetical protein [Alphaproteobacteria bacterium]
MSMLFISITLLTILVPLSAHAYIGPGLAVTFVWTLIGPIAALVTAIALIAYFPIRYFYKKWKSRKKTTFDK